MAIIVDPSLNPRIVTIPIADGTDITLQSLHDQIRSWEEQPDSQSYKRLLLSTGKEDLGGGTSVGITSTLQDAQLEFAGRTATLESGTVTTPDTLGLTLIDSTATFQANSIGRGDLIVNYTDKSLTVVITVDSETQITTRALEGGSDNQWDSSDAYSVYNVVQCNISGGNLVAIDTNGATIDPIFPSVNTQVVRTSSSSATISEREDINIKYLIESNRAGHSAYGNVFYWSPTDGNDGSDGTSPSTARKTFLSTYALTVADNNDVIMAIPDATGGETIVTEQIILNKASTFLRGPGANFEIAPATDVLPISITGRGAEFSGFHVVGLAGSGTTNAITVAAEDVLIRDILIDTSGNNGIEFSGDCSHSIIDYVTVNKSNLNGMLINHPSRELTIMNCKIHASGQATASSGIKLVSSVAPTTRINSITATQLHHNTRYGIEIGSGVVTTIIGQDNILGLNTLGDVLDDGDLTVQNTWKTIIDTKLIVGDNQALILSG